MVAIEHTEALLSTKSAHLLAFFFAAAYVGSIYLSKNARLSFSKTATAHGHSEVPRVKQSDERWRNDPEVIKARLLAVSLATFLCCGVVFGVVRSALDPEVDALSETFKRLGFALPGSEDILDQIITTVKPHVVTPLLFLGPVYALYLGSALPGQKHWTFAGSVKPLFATMEGLRNYVAAPITEELVFRACVLAVYRLAGTSTKKMIFLTPLSFGLAHVHHAWDTYNRFGRTSGAAKRAILGSVFQLAYTTLFGFHTAYLFLRTGSILVPITSHIWCNIMGFPQPGYEVRMTGRKKSIYAAYVAGIVLFAVTMGPWTKVKGNMYWP